MKKSKCSICESTKKYHWHFVDGKTICHDCYSPGPQSGIYDATGKRRDRNWLSKKLKYTKSETAWHEDIKSRRSLPDGSVGRFKGGIRVE